jgi:hypothetical protein
MGNEFGNTGYYQIINGNGECLGVGGGSSDEGVAIYGWECTGTGYPDQ